MPNGRRIEQMAMKYNTTCLGALAPWSSGIVSACGVTDRVIESRQGMGGSFLEKKQLVCVCCQAKRWH
jgi:hypothetical protein